MSVNPVNSITTIEKLSLNAIRTSNKTPLDYELFAKDPFKRPELMNNVAPRYVGQLDQVSYYGVPASFGRAQRGAILIQLLDYVDSYECVDSEVEAWFWTMTEIIFPGLAATLLDAAGYTGAIRTEFDERQLNYLIGGGSNKERREAYKELHPTVEDVDIPKMDDLDYVESPGYLLLPDLNFDDTKIEKNWWVPLVNAYGIIVFAIGKTPNAKNITAFAKRFRAVSNKAGLIEGSDENLTPDDLPVQKTYSAVNSYFTLRTKLRLETVKEFVKWTITQGTPEQELIATQTRLWNGMGMHHISLIAGLIMNHGVAISLINELSYELEKFKVQYRAFMNDTDLFRGYWKVMYGDKKTVLHSREFEELLKLSLHFDKEKKPTMALYAQSLGESTFVTRLLEIERRIATAEDH